MAGQFLEGLGRLKALPLAGPEGLRRLHRPVTGAVLDLLLPPQCPACQAPIGTPHQLCGACFAAMRFISEPLCIRCGLGFEIDPGGVRICFACQALPPAYDRARAALQYDEAAKRLILPFKHGDRIELAAVLARMMLRAGAALLAEAPLLVPVPLHRTRLRHRRYNQAALLAQVIGRRAGLDCQVDGLGRLRATPPLGDLGAAARRRMLRDVFAVGRSAGVVAGRRVLLVDDVLTSGATASACAEALRAAGARAVDVLVAARVPPPQD